MATLTQAQEQFLEEPHVGVVTTLREDGSPHSTIVWVDIEDGVVSFNTARGRVKPTNIERDPRVALLVVDPRDSYRWLALDGRAEITADGAEAQIDRLAKKYMDADEYPWRKAGQQRLTVRIAPTRITAYGLD